ncbi:putative Monocarboxylate transporter 12 [Hypsibius exemplaris]|uniref:Monocarboxylate transporter 12 n=1 Tax=Hypsibius exemplaris TaxID=2072580 RepID=A0A1W0XE32_HYPEX|nr:putative Monocarboxylate transporter 12 [Hypsibius exemplaris]
MPSEQSRRAVAHDGEDEKMYPIDKEQGGNHTEEETIKVVPIAPDGGFGWVIVACSFFCNFIVDGVCYSFGVYVMFWTEAFPEASKLQIALIGSLLNGVYLLMGPISSALTNAFGFKIVIFSGAIISAVAFIISMFATSVPFLIGTFGVLGGIGFGLIYSPAILCVCYYFDKRRAMAVGICVCGSGVGAFLFPPLVTLIIDHFAWQGSMLILAGLVLQVCIAGALMRTLEVTVVEEVEIRPVLKPEEIPLTQISEKETLTYVRDAGPGLARTVSQEAVGGNFRDLKHVDKGRERTVSGASGDLEYVRSRRYSSKDGIDVQTVDDQGRVVHQRMSGSHRQYSSQHDLDAAGVLTKHTEVARPLDRKDVLVHGSLRNLDRQQSEQADQEAFKRTSLKRRQEQKALEAAAVTGKPVKKSWMPPQLRQALIEMIDVTIYKNPVFLIYSLASFLGMLAFYIPFTFISDFAKERYGLDNETASLFISGIGAANIFGRIFWGWLADRPRSDPLLIHNICITIVGITIGFIPLCFDFTSLMVVSVVFGFFVSPFISLLSIILTSRIGLTQLPSAFGQSQLVRGIASLIGTPIGGALYAINKNYDMTFLASGAAFIIAAIIASFIFVLAFFTLHFSRCFSRCCGR